MNAGSEHHQSLDHSWSQLYQSKLLVNETYPEPIGLNYLYFMTALQTKLITDTVTRFIMRSFYDLHEMKAHTAF
jgi:hypothetical protein